MAQAKLDVYNQEVAKGTSIASEACGSVEEMDSTKKDQNTPQACKDIKSTTH